MQKSYTKHQHTKSSNIEKGSYTTIKDGSVFTIQSIWYTTFTKWVGGVTWSSQYMQKKHLKKIQHPFMIKTLIKVGIEGTYLNIISTVYDKPTANMTLRGIKPSFSSKIRNKAGIPTLTPLSCESGCGIERYNLLWIKYKRNKDISTAQGYIDNIL